MMLKKRVEDLEAKISVSGEETVFETQTLQELQAKLKAENKPTEPFSLEKIQKLVSAKP